MVSRFYAVVPPPFIAPQYEEIVEATHGKSYNIITEEGRFASLVREMGHSNRDRVFAHLPHSASHRRCTESQSGASSRLWWE